MNTNLAQILRGYQAIVMRDGKVIDSIEISAQNRRKAVYTALLWFWYKYHGSVGPACKAMTVTDPYREVRYGPRFICNDRINKLLSSDVCRRVIKESNGELKLDRRQWRPHHGPNSVKRVKRRRDFGKFIAPCIKRMKSGTMYYRITLVSQKTKNGRRIRKRKYRDIRLKAQTLISALDEIKARELFVMNQLTVQRKMNVRDLTFVAHIIGLITASTLTDEQRKKFSKVMRRYGKPHLGLKFS